MASCSSAGSRRGADMATVMPRAQCRGQVAQLASPASSSGSPDPPRPAAGTQFGRKNGRRPSGRRSHRAATPRGRSTRLPRREVDPEPAGTRQRRRRGRPRVPPRARRRASRRIGAGRLADQRGHRGGRGRCLQPGPPLAPARRRAPWRRRCRRPARRSARAPPRRSPAGAVVGPALTARGVGGDRCRRRVRRVPAARPPARREPGWRSPPGNPARPRRSRRRSPGVAGDRAGDQRQRRGPGSGRIRSPDRYRCCCSSARRAACCAHAGLTGH